MGTQTEGLETGRTASTNDSPKPADTSPASDSLPTSQGDFHDDTRETEDAGRKEAREILRGMVKEGKGPKADSDDEPAALAEAEELAGETDTPPAAEAKKPAEKTPETKDAGDAALSAARDALIRDGWTGSDLDKLPPERILAMGSKRQGQQKQQDGFGRQKAEELATLRARLAELEGGNASQPPAGTQEQDPAATTDPFADPDLSDVGKTLDKLDEYAGSEVKDVVKNAFASLHAKFKGQLASVTQAAEAQVFNGLRQELTTEFPALKDDTKFSAVQDKMRSLVKTGEYKGIGDAKRLLRDACLVVLPPPTIQDLQRKMVDEDRRVEDGQMDAGNRSRSANASKPDEKEQARSILRLMSKGKSADEARRLVLRERS